MGERLQSLAINGVLWDAAHDNVGIYPQSVRGGECAYEKRTERMEGWNECVSAHAHNFYALRKWYDKIPAESKNELTDLLLADKISVSVNDKECSCYINCSDMFVWGCSDSEDITFDDFASLRECLTLTPCGTDLWVCRKRGQRPQGAYYSYIPEEHWHLFHACGPEREVGLGNPYAPGGYKRRRPDWREQNG